MSKRRFDEGKTSSTSGEKPMGIFPLLSGRRISFHDSLYRKQFSREYREDVPESSTAAETPLEPRKLAKRERGS